MSDNRHSAARVVPAQPPDAATSAGAPPGPRADELLPFVYDDLRRAARAQLAALAPGQTLQPTALVHAAYLRLVDKTGAGWDGARHFFFAAARAMHDILVEHARAKACLKRGGRRGRLDLDRLTVAQESPADEMLALAEALGELQARDERQHRIVMLRFFAGCTAQEAADATALSLRSANREWAYARAWLHKRLSSDAPEGAPPTSS